MQVYPMNIKFGEVEETVVCEITAIGCIVQFRDRRIHFTKFSKNIRKQIIRHIMHLQTSVTLNTNLL